VAAQRSSVPGVPRAAPVSLSDAAPSPGALSASPRDATPDAAHGHRQRFSRRRRIVASVIFRKALASRPGSRGDWFDVYCVATLAGSGMHPAAPDASRLGLVVPKRICRSAARRNWIKRLVRESFRREMPVSLAIDCVVRLRRALSLADAAAARSELSAHWRRVGG